MARLEGPDFSKWQPLTPPLTGQSFAFARATYATSPDLKFGMHVANFRKAGLAFIGAYHFGVGAAQAAIADQVTAFLRAAVPWNVDGLVLDVERNNRVRERNAEGEWVWRQLPTMTRTEGREFIRLLRVKVPGKPILLYSSRGTWPGDLGQDANWIADYTLAARVVRRPLTRLPWAFWQWTNSPWDRNYFNGDLAALRRLAGSRLAKPPAVTPPKASGQTVTVPKGASFWAYSISGTRSTGYTIRRQSKVTKLGFTAPLGASRIDTKDNPAFPLGIWGGRRREWAEIIAGGSAGTWVDLLEGENIIVRNT